MTAYKPTLPTAAQLEKSMHYLLMACPAGVCSISYPSLLKTSITVLLPMKWPAVERKMTSELNEHREREGRTTKSFLITGGVPLRAGSAISLPTSMLQKHRISNEWLNFPRVTSITTLCLSKIKMWLKLFWSHRLLHYQAPMAFLGQ